PVATGAIATATVGGLSDNTAYHWRARAFDHTTRSDWVSFGNNVESAADFRVAVPVTQLVFTQPPTTTTASAPIAPPVQVTAQDALGNTVTSFSGSVTVALAANPGGDTLSGTKTIAAVNGVATFSDLSIDRAASGYTLRATTSGLTVTSAPFTIVAGTATQIAINAGNDQTVPAGTDVPVAPSVIVRDAHGNPVAGVSVSFAVAPGNGTITGASQTTNASGIATVTSWTLGTTVGTNTLRATSQGLNGSPVIFTATSRPAAPSASRSLVSVTPGVITASTGSSVATISVTVRDGFDNPIPGATVMLAATPSTGNTLTQALGTTDASGEITGSLSSTAAGTKTVTATVNGTLVITETATVTVTAGAVSASQSTVAAAP